MNKLLPYLVVTLSLALAGPPAVAHAASDAGDYVAARVPDLAQAVTFFRDVMNCSVISDGGGSPSATATLMACGRETTLEITQASARAVPSSGKNSPAITLDIDDAAAVAGWLRASHVRPVGSPTRVADGQDAGKLAATFLTPWGQPLRLVSRMRTDDLLDSGAPSPRVAVQ